MWNCQIPTAISCRTWAGWGWVWIEFAGAVAGVDIGRVNWAGLMKVVDCLGASGAWLLLIAERLYSLMLKGYISLY
jgi:hypothetical protein